MEDIMAQISEVEKELKKFSIKSNNPFVNLYRSFRKNRIIKKYMYKWIDSLGVSKITYDDARAIGILYNNFSEDGGAQYVRLSIGFFKGFPTRVHMGTDSVNFYLNLINEDQEAEVKSIQFNYEFIESGTIHVNRIMNFSDRREYKSKDVEDGVLDLVFIKEGIIFDKVVLNHIITKVYRYLFD